MYNLTVKNIKGEDVALSQYKGKVLLVVNVASKCGFTPQYEGLQELYSKYKNEGLEVLGFPSNDFKKQEPEANEKIASFCALNYLIDFDMFSKIKVNGKDADPLYKLLKNEARGFWGSKSIKWNFTKFLVSKEGVILKRYAPFTKPHQLEKDIERLLAKG